jgi:hypothetical protein
VCRTVVRFGSRGTDRASSDSTSQRRARPGRLLRRRSAILVSVSCSVISLVCG